MLVSIPARNMLISILLLIYQKSLFPLSKRFKKQPDSFRLIFLGIDFHLP